MRGVKDFSNVYLYRQFVDFRKGINSLCTLVESHLGLSSQEKSSLFVFCNRSRNKVRILYWDLTGFALWQKHLEEEKFKWPWCQQSESEQLNVQQLEWLLSGIDVTKLTTHKEKSYKKVV